MEHTKVYGRKEMSKKLVREGVALFSITTGLAGERKNWSVRYYQDYGIMISV